MESKAGFPSWRKNETRHQLFNLIFVGGIIPKSDGWIFEVYPQTKGGKMEHEEFQAGDSNVWSYAGWQASGRSVQRRFLGKHNFGGSYLKGYRVLLLFLVANLISNLILRPSIRTFEIFVILGTNMSPRHCFSVDDFPFHHVAYVSSLEGHSLIETRLGGAHPLISGWDCNHICCAEERWDQRGWWEHHLSWLPSWA